MPPIKFSRYQFVSQVLDETLNQLFLTDREKFAFQDFADNMTHRAREGDSLYSLANKAFRGMTNRPARFYWVIADFQPEPIHDPTLKLKLGRLMFIPSLRTLVEDIFSQRREAEAAP